MKEQIEKLVEKWIEEERQMRASTSFLGSANVGFSESRILQANADLLSSKRRELQEAAGLAVVP